MVPINVSCHDLQENHFQNIELNRLVVTNLYPHQSRITLFTLLCLLTFYSPSDYKINGEMKLEEILVGGTNFAIFL
jgi:hypothetical protein